MGWHAPRQVFVSVGDGNILSGVWKGFQDLLAAGWIDAMPKLFGVQAEGSAACYNAWQRARASGLPARVEPVEAHTIADSISVGLPRDGTRAVRAVQETQGEFVLVSDQEILSAMKTLASDAAVFAEPAGAAGFAGLQKAIRQHKVGSDETVVVIVTGNGLKDVPAAMQAAGAPLVIDPTMEALTNAIDERKLQPRS